jgi:hypothetical protein
LEFHRFTSIHGWGHWGTIVNIATPKKIDTLFEDGIDDLFPNILVVFIVFQQKMTILEFLM